MRSSVFFPVGIVCSITVLLLIGQGSFLWNNTSECETCELIESGKAWLGLPMQDEVLAARDGAARDGAARDGAARDGAARLPDGDNDIIFSKLDSYDDEDYGFSVAVPAGWRRIIAEDSDAESDALSGQDIPNLELGYAVGFESDRQSETDIFADYVLIEILPGNDSGLFTTDHSNRYPVIVDRRQSWYERLEIDQASSGLTDVDLVIYQAELRGVGYTAGFYAIGEPSNEASMAAAFKVMLKTFTMNAEPFSTS